MIDDEEPAPRRKGLEEALGMRRRDRGRHVLEDLREIRERGADMAVAMIGVPMPRTNTVPRVSSRARAARSSSRPAST